MTPTSPTHTWTISPSSKYLRFHLWLYEANPKTLNFCKLFWGFLMIPLALIIRGVVGVGILVGDAFAALNRTRPEKVTKAPKVKVKKLKVTRTTPSLAARMVAAVARAADRVVAGFQRVGAFFKAHPAIGNSIGRVVGGLAFLALVGLAVGAVWSAVWAISTFTLGLLSGLAFMGIVIGCCTAAALLVIGLALLVQHNEWGMRVLDKLLDGLTVIGHGFRFAYRFLALGLHSLKYRTCPAVLVK